MDAFSPYEQINESERTYHELLVKLKTFVAQLNSQQDAMLCVRWIQKLQTFTKPNDVRLRNYLLLQMCKQIQFGYLNHPFVNLKYLDDDLNVIANCCRELDYEIRPDSAQTYHRASIASLSDCGGENETRPIDVMRKSLENSNFVIGAQDESKRRNRNGTEYQDTRENFKQTKHKLDQRSIDALDQFVQYLGATFVEKYHNVADELESIEGSPNLRDQLLAFRLNFSSNLKLACGNLMSATMADSLFRAENRFQNIFCKILSSYTEDNECIKDTMSTDHTETWSTDLHSYHANNTKYINYLKRFIKQQKKQHNRKMAIYEQEIDGLKKEIDFRDKQQIIKLMEMKCQHMLNKEENTKNQLSQTIDELESKYQIIVQNLIRKFREQTP